MHVLQPERAKAYYAEFFQVLQQSYICCILLVVRVSKGRVLVDLLMGIDTRRGCRMECNSSLPSAPRPQQANSGSRFVPTASLPIWQPFLTSSGWIWLDSPYERQNRAGT